MIFIPEYCAAVIKRRPARNCKHPYAQKVLDQSRFLSLHVTYPFYRCLHVQHFIKPESARHKFRSLVHPCGCRFAVHVNGSVQGLYNAFG